MASFDGLLPKFCSLIISTPSLLIRRRTWIKKIPLPKSQNLMTTYICVAGSVTHLLVCFVKISIARDFLTKWQRNNFCIYLKSKFSTWMSKNTLFKKINTIDINYWKKKRKFKKEEIPNWNGYFTSGKVYLCRVIYCKPRELNFQEIKFVSTGNYFLMVGRAEKPSWC